MLLGRKTTTNNIPDLNYVNNIWCEQVQPEKKLLKHVEKKPHINIKVARGGLNQKNQRNHRKINSSETV